MLSYFKIIINDFKLYLFCFPVQNLLILSKHVLLSIIYQYSNEFRLKKNIPNSEGDTLCLFIFWLQ